MQAVLAPIKSNGYHINNNSSALVKNRNLTHLNMGEKMTAYDMKEEKNNQTTRNQYGPMLALSAIKGANVISENDSSNAASGLTM